MNGYWQAVAAVVRKDALIELRSRESLGAMIVFAAMTLVLINFGLRLRVDSMRALGPAALWITIVFAGTLGLGRSLANEQISQAMDELLLAPHDPSYIFVGKAAANALFMALMGLIATPLVAIFFDERVLHPGVLLTVLLGVAGYAGAGTLVAILAASTRAREVMLPILLLPLAVPLAVASVIATAGFVDALPLADFSAWIGVVVAFGVIFWAAGALLFEYVTD